jgi:trk system potassium uptake protein TrkA
MYMIVVGGGKVGYYLAKTLILEGYEVLLIEKDAEKCTIYEERFGAAVMHGDGAEAATLQAAGADRADVVIATTGHDEDNLIICQVAKLRFGVERAIARVNNPKNEEIFRKLGVDVTVSQTNIIMHLIEQYIPQRRFMHLMTLKHADLEIVEASVAADSRVVGRQLTEITLPPDTVFSAVFRGEQVIVPTGQTMLQAGDEVIAVTRRERENELRRLLVNV